GVGGGFGGWERLGTLQVGPGRDHDVIAVGSNIGQVRELRLEVRGGPVEMTDVTVTFVDGNTFKPNFRSRFDERSRSEEIDLPGNRRAIRQVDFTYSTSQSGVTLTVYAR
ncbi:MAG TPA: hypothetical protein VMT22_16165, partial [Terriglobales bacterium]|nr:hypothetical protein [Terriglobales bacterium]